ncbi:protein spinster homolog 1-like [Diadema setosum]|uniref:protein spinster homolog 1-like n=1 Tax=Diadema setosum TaxID=31175 RepID=UPI003B3ADFD8
MITPSKASDEGSDIIQPSARRGDSVEMATTTSWVGDVRDKKPLLEDEDGNEDADEEAAVREYADRSTSGQLVNVGHVQVNGATGNIVRPEHEGGSVTGRDAYDTRNSTDEQDQESSDDHDDRPKCSAYVTVIVLFCVNLLNYSDRYTIAANLPAIQQYFNIEDNNSAAGLLQTIFIVGYMLTSPIFGYLGDRYSRKMVVSFGILFWSATTLAGSFIPSDLFWLFLLLRGLVGVGEASYVTIAATLIGDLFTGNRRTRMLMVFYFAIPVGSGFGYISGKLIAELAHNWKWALRFTPPLGFVCVFLILVLIKEPKRGQAETGHHTMTNTSYIADIKALCKNKSYITSTFGLTTVCWVTGALALWAVEAVEDAYRLQGENPNSVSIIFGVITVAAGFIGVASGTTLAQLLRRRTRQADPLVCAVGMFVGAPFLFIALELSDISVGITWTFVFIAETLICLNWALVPDILLAVLIPTRRSTGNAIQMLISHLCGDALSPWLVGAISDRIRDGFEDHSSYEAKYTSLIYALFSTCFVMVLGGGFFLFNALYYEQDKKRVEDIVAKMNARDEPQTSAS